MKQGGRDPDARPVGVVVTGISDAKGVALQPTKPGGKPAAASAASKGVAAKGAAPGKGAGSGKGTAQGGLHVAGSSDSVGI